MKTKIGVIGAGRWGKNIINTLHNLGVLAGIAEPNANLRNDIHSLYPNIPVFDSHQKLLDTEIPAVAIATPVFTHFEIAKEALLAGKDVFVEKPMTVNLEESDELVLLAKQKNKILMVGHMLLYQPAIQFIKQFIGEGQLGRLYSLRQVRRNLGTIRTQENVLYSLGVHDLAVLNYLVGEKVVDSISTGHAITTANIEDDMTVHLTYASGVQAHLHVSWLWPVKDRQLMILGEKGALHYDELSHTVIFHQRFGNSDATITDRGEEIVFKGSGEPLRLEMEHFIDCIVHRKLPLSHGQQGADVVELMESLMGALENV